MMSLLSSPISLSGGKVTIDGTGGGAISFSWSYCSSPPLPRIENILGAFGEGSFIWGRISVSFMIGGNTTASSHSCISGGGDLRTLGALLN
ncbi:ORF348 [White spot syndrome virus]|uniref:Wsv317 n=3 Tax=White spot syndrome virus TaxID=342409 RepID=Q8VAS5_WSSVS|nr:wsv317 [Shrimp white spot syndrome virus]AFX59694.1 wsv317 [White spot syndrome virus]AAL33319.1 wsv317 [Shrimp white spot syndrome virus]AAL89241.1 WSSV373 [Shrimp white spot syndrome virus]ATU83731.1 ORF348 [White spot syndrome virus]AWQ60448.1 wsv317 [Shrimp white spot syndrome virus]